MNHLNQKLFELSTGEMRPAIRDRLLEIADEFLIQLDNIDFNIIDIRLVGSNASYNYTENSDIDLHIVVNLYEICQCHPEIVQSLFNAEKSRFNTDYDIQLKGIPVEIYVEDVRAGTMSRGIYSVLYNCWVKYTEEAPTDDSNLIVDKSYVDQLEFEIENIISTEDSKLISNFIDDLYMMRKNSLESSGESGEGNLVFKEIRNRGLLDRLKDAYYDSRSKELSLENLIK